MTNNIFVRFLRYSVLWSEHRKVVKILNTLTDRELKDIGLTRGEIDNMVWLETDKQQRGKRT